MLEARRVLSAAAGVQALSNVYVHVPDNLTGQPSQQVATPVDIDNAAGVRAAEIRINYDTTLLDADVSSVQAGSVWTDSAQVVANVDDTSGTIIAWVFAPEALGSGGGSLLNVEFTVKGTATVGDSTAIDLAQVRLNEGAIVPSPEPVPGPDSTDGLITIVNPENTASISGVVYADTNGNHQPDSFEGVPRVRIVLVGPGDGQQRETYTDDNGQYQFQGLAAGAYQIQEQQPAALLDGGTNSISVTLAAGQSLTNQNFRELGLRPEYVYNRLFTTTALPVGSTNWNSVVRNIITSAGSSSVQSQVTSASVAAAATTASRAAVHQTTATASSPSLTLATASEPQAAQQSTSGNLGTSPSISQPSPSVSALSNQGSSTDATAATVYVHVPDNLTGQPSQQVATPVDIDNSVGVRAAEIHINYDTTLLDADSSSVEAGSVWPAETQVVANVDDVAGTIVASVATAEALGSGGGSLLNVQFTIKSTAPVGDSTTIDLAEVQLNEGAIVPDPMPVPGPDATDGKITIVGAGDTASVSGIVYADTNSNTQPDSYEGIPRVKIVLTGIDNTQQRETYTDDTGQYQFQGLPAGTYQIQEQQPAALLDGGTNTISVTLASGQSLTNQNFRELGLRPEYVYNRLFTTTALPVGSTNWTTAVRRIITDSELTDSALASTDSWL